MFRERAHVKTGCERCKIRRKKCDEQRPSCGYCTKWNLVCRYLSNQPSVFQAPEIKRRRTLVGQKNCSGSDYKKNLYKRPSTVQSRADTIICPTVSTASDLDPFVLLPIRDARRRREINHELWTFFQGMIRSATPYDAQSPRQVLAQGWFEGVLSDAAVCCAILSYAAKFQSYKPQTRSLRLFGLELMTKTVQLIQTKLDQGNFLDNNVLLASSVHMVASAIEDFSPVYLLRLAKGIKALIHMRGGFNQISATLPFSTVVSLLVADCLVSRSTGKGPFLIDNYPEPKCPTTMDGSLMTTDPAILQHWDLEVIKILEATKFALLFREPAFVARKLSNAESWYIFELHMWIDVRLNHLQERHFSTGSVSEIATLTLIILKIEVVVEAPPDKHINRAVLKHLKCALQTYMDAADEIRPPNGMIVWSCSVAAAGPGLISERRFFWETLHNLGLKTTDEILSIAMGFAWHECLNHALLYYEQLFPSCQ